MRDESNFERFLDFVNLEESDRVPLAELLADADVIKAMLKKQDLDIEDHIRFHKKAGMAASVLTSLITHDFQLSIFSYASA